METKTIYIDITAESSQTEYNENAGVMWEHNATQLVFNLDDCFVGDYRYYIEYRSLLGTKVRTEYLELNGNTVTYLIPAEMTGLKTVECYFNIISIDEDGNTTQVIKPKKFCLDFDFSPDTDNSIAKVNDFSINYLLEAIRLGTFKGDKGDKGEKGDTGEKGDKGDTGEMTFEYADKTYSNALKKTLTGIICNADDVSPFEHKLTIKVSNAENCENVRACGKNLFDAKSSEGFLSKYGGITNEIVDNKIITRYTSASTAQRGGNLLLGTFPAGTYFVSADEICNIKSGNDLEEVSSTTASYGKTPTKIVLEETKTLWVYRAFTPNEDVVTTNLQIEAGDVQTEYELPKVSTYTLGENKEVEAVSTAPYMTILTDFSEAVISCEYNRDLNRVIEKLENAIL